MSNHPAHTQVTDPVYQWAHQRGIPRELIAALLRSCSTLMYGRHSGRIVGFKQSSRERMRRALGPKTYARLSDRLDVCAGAAQDTAWAIGRCACGPVAATAAKSPS